MAAVRRKRHDRGGGSLAGGLLALLFGIVLSLALGEMAARLMFPRWSEFDSRRFITMVPVAGWPDVAIGTPGFDGWFSQNNGDFRSHIHINEFGLRNDEPVGAADGRLWAVGDSFTFGWGVGRDEIFGAVTAARLGMPWYSVASPGTDVCGYRTLVARMPKEARPAAVLVGVTIENDLMEYDCAARAHPPSAAPAAEGGLRLPPLIYFKHGLTSLSALYNFIAVSVKQVSSLENLLVGLRLIAPLAAEQRQFPDDRLEAVLDSTADELARLRGEVPPGTPFSVVVIPGRRDLMSGDAYYRSLREGLVARLGARSVPTVDPLGLFEPEGAGRIHFAHDGHWSALGHRLAGEAAARTLGELLPAVAAQ